MKTTLTLAIGILMNVLWITSGCQDQYTICNQNKDVVMKAGFYRISGGAPVGAVAPELSVSSILGTTIFSRQTGVPAFTLTLNPVTDSVQYIIKMDNGLPNDTITVGYTTSTVVLSPDCGSIFNHNLTRVRTSTHVLDSIQIVDPFVRNSIVENVRIFF
jgi:hypothetical protein